MPPASPGICRCRWKITAGCISGDVQGRLSELGKGTVSNTAESQHSSTWPATVQSPSIGLVGLRYTHSFWQPVFLQWQWWQRYTGRKAPSSSNKRLILEGSLGTMLMQAGDDLGLDLLLCLVASIILDRKSSLSSKKWSMTIARKNSRCSNKIPGVLTKLGL